MPLPDPMLPGPVLPDPMLAESWALGASVALRPEPFGALAYHFGTRRLSFLKTPELVDVVRRLDDSSCVEDALREVGVPPSHWPTYLRALHGLADGAMITRKAAA